MTKNKDLTGIHGWLAFFVFGCVVSVIFNFILGVEDVSMVLESAPPSQLRWLLPLDVVLWAGLILFIIYQIYSLVELKPNAVALTKMMLVLTIFMKLVGFVFIELSGQSIPEGTFYNSSTLVSTSILGIIWFLYFCESKRVRNTYPLEKRHVYNRDKVFFFILLAIPVVIYALAFVGVASPHSIESQDVPTSEIAKTRALRINEFTDGRIYFSKPEGWQLNKTFSGITPIFVMVEGNQSSLTLVSDVNKEETVGSYFEKNFDAGFNSVKGELSLDFNLISDINGTTSRGYIYLDRSILIKGEEEYVWGMIVVFDSKTSKIGLVGYFTPNKHFFEVNQTKIQLVDSMKFE